MRTFNVSGTAMDVLREADVRLDPAVGGPLRDAKPRRKGAGVSYTVSATDEGAELLYEWCLLSALELVQAEVDEDKRRTGRALLVVVKNIERAADVEGGECPCGAPVGLPGDYCRECDPL